MNFLNLSLVALLVVIACTSAIPHSRLTIEDITGCNRACPDIYLPVCGFNNKEYKIFDNDCSMETANCIQHFQKNDLFSEKSMNLCEQKIVVKNECNKICTLEYSPICGSDSKTYGNMCMFDTANCKSNYKLRITRNGECSEVPAENDVKKNCDRICPATFIPVCGFDGKSYKTYANTCQFDIMNCYSDNHLRMISMAACPEEKENVETNEVKNECNKICTLEYSPICGSDSKTYGNMCMFDTANCKSNYKLRITRNEECSEVPAENDVKKNCDRICPATFIPVCGFDGKSYKTYANTCQFDIMNCYSDNHLRMISMEACPEEKENIEPNEVKNECNKICTLEYNPICGSDSKTYGNMCMFDTANCKSNYKLRITRNGECSEANVVKNDCNKICTLEYSPICGSDSKTYGNMCMFDTANCKSNYKLRITRNGECSEVPTETDVKKNCDRVCPTTFIPVCGFDGKKYKTYANTCQFDIMNCYSDNHLRMISMEACPEEKENVETNEVKNECNKICTLEYSPICGSDSKTYGNMCMFDTANCKSNYKLRITRNGECSEVPAENNVKKNCDRICPATFIPVCGFDGKSYKTYANTCQFDIMNCYSDNHLRMISMEACPEEKENIEPNEVKNECNKICTLEYNPICGSDSKTYGNMCMFDTANCKSNYKLRITRNGECSEANVVKNDCNKICTLEYSPICGSDSKTYGNMCMFDTANCKSNYKLRITRNGECSEVPTETDVKKNCDRACPTTFIPVCGFDGKKYKTYANTCQFDIMNCYSDNHLRMISMEACPEEKENVETNEVKNECNKICTLEYSPICGSDSKTYGNMCMFDTANCKSNYKLRITRNGECSETNVVKNDCNKICTLEYSPICGSDSKTYGNMCMFETANCESNYKLRITRNGECSETNVVKNDCNKICTLEYSPICGSDSKTYGNMCMFETANCESNYKLRITRNGECSETNVVKNDCNKICTLEYSPICGSDSKTYGNMCMFETANCESNYKLRITRNGECSETKVVKNDCNKICTLEYSPICGSDSKTYGNMCMFETANCESNYKLRITRNGECSEANVVKNDCNKVCTLEYSPICGSDSKTYGNMCMFETANCELNNNLRIARIGVCDIADEIPAVKEIKSECIRPCPASYLPVCGFNGESYHTYGNTCEFEMMNCDSDNHLRMVRNGEC